MCREETDKIDSGLARDRQFVEQVRGGDLSPFDIIYQENWVMIKDFILKNSGSAQEAKDIYQEGMLVLLRRFRTADFQLSAKISSFLYAVVRNLWLKKLRKPAIDLDSELEIPDVSEEISLEEEEDYRMKQVKRALGTLGEKCRKIIRMFYIEGASMDEIAGELGYTNSANAKNQKYKCFKQLKTELGVE